MDFEIDVIFEVCEGNFFSVEVNRFETIRDIKKKIQTIYQIPISQQSFIFKGQLLQDHLYVYTTPILHHSRIHLSIVTDDAENTLPPPPSMRSPSFLAQPLQLSTLPRIEDNPLLLPDISSLSQRRTLTASVKMPKSKDRVRIELDREDTFGKLKEKIAAHEDMQGVPAVRIALQLHSKRQELNDDMAVQDYSVEDNPEIDVFLKPALPAAGRGRTQSGKLKVKVLPMETNERIEIEVFPWDAVSVLRPKLEELQRILQFRLPGGNGYFFIHRQQDMHEEKSFHWHGVRDGDTIETFDGFILTDSSS